MALLEVTGLHVEIDGREILRGLDLAVDPGEVHTILGPNGSGKVDILALLKGQEFFT